MQNLPLDELLNKQKEKPYLLVPMYILLVVFYIIFYLLLHLILQ